jgi:hypothetical protein
MVAFGCPGNVAVVIGTRSSNVRNRTKYFDASSADGTTIQLRRANGSTRYTLDPATRVSMVIRTQPATNSAFAVGVLPVHPGVGKLYATNTVDISDVEITRVDESCTVMVLADSEIIRSTVAFPVAVVEPVLVAVTICTTVAVVVRVPADVVISVHPSDCARLVAERIKR